VFRRWRRPTVRSGGTLRTAVGVLAVDSVDVVQPGGITADHARRAGYPDRASLLRDLDPNRPGARDGQLYRIRVHWAGEDPRRVLARSTALDADDGARIGERLAGLDAASRHGPWTARTLELIAAHPAVRAPELARRVGRETAPFKLDVRKLKELGLTESLTIGYRLSPRGVAYLALGGPAERGSMAAPDRS
jgi:hypothetical protein